MFGHALLCLLAVWRTFAGSNGQAMTRQDRLLLRDEARDMFYHAYRAYMENAYPADELMPLSCAGRYRGSSPSRGDIDDSLGNFSLTLIDTLDTLVVLGDLEEFDHAVKLVVRDVSFDKDVVVSVFETNIRVLGGLLSAHVLAEYVQQHADVLRWYGGELLAMAKDIGYRLLPAFNTTTGIPYAKVNLRHGLNTDKLEAARETCTACAGSSILEMAALSRLTGEPAFEAKARKAMDVLWKMRHRSSDLMGTILNVHSGDWVRRDSGVGAGIDSYYEYCLKAYVLLGDEEFLNRFNRHYNAVMKYVSQGPMLLDVHMHRPHTNSRNYMDALLAFWPGLQVLKGDLKPAVETHEMLYQVAQRHKFIPEAFTTDFQVHWGNHPLRPEFLESTYFLYAATRDPYYLEVGRNVLESLQRYARVPCGYAAVNDVHTGEKEDRMDSFVLAETFKYLYLLFADADDLLLDLDEFVFTTEGHLLPLSLGRSNVTRPSWDETDDDFDDTEFARTCPNTLRLFPETFRKPLKNMVDGVCPRRLRRKLTAGDFSPTNLNHLAMIKDMGVHIAALSDGRVQLLHSFASAKTPSDAEEGLLFMQEMVEFAKRQTDGIEAAAAPPPQSVSYVGVDGRPVILQAGPSQFGINFSDGGKLTAAVTLTRPWKACGPPPPAAAESSNVVGMDGKIAVVERGDCMFVEKARRVQAAGAAGAIVVDTGSGGGAGEATSFMFSMSGDGTDDVSIPVVFLSAPDALRLLLAVSERPQLSVTIAGERTTPSDRPEDASVFQKLKLSVRQFLNRHAGIIVDDEEDTSSMSFDEFRAEIVGDRLRVTTHDIGIETTPNAADVGESANPEWSRIRRGLLESLLASAELSVPVGILRIYHRTLGGDDTDDVKSAARWLLRQLAIERTSRNVDVASDTLKTIVETVDALHRQVVDDDLKSTDEIVGRQSAEHQQKCQSEKVVSEETVDSNSYRNADDEDESSSSDYLVIGPTDKSEVIIDSGEKRRRSDEL